MQFADFGAVANNINTRIKAIFFLTL